MIEDPSLANIYPGKERGSSGARKKVWSRGTEAANVLSYSRVAGEIKPYREREDSVYRPSRDPLLGIWDSLAANV